MFGVSRGLMGSFCVFVCQNLLLLNPTERFLTEQSLNHHAFQTLRLVERPGPPTPTPVRSSKRKPHHGDNTTPSRSAVCTIADCLYVVQIHSSVIFFLCKCDWLFSNHQPWQSVCSDIFLLNALPFRRGFRHYLLVQCHSEHIK